MNKKAFSAIEVILVIVIIVITAFVLVQCGLKYTGNKQIFDTTFKYDYAYIELPNGYRIEGEVESWTDFEDGDQIQVTFTDGDTYLVHSSDIALVHHGG